MNFQQLSDALDGLGFNGGFAIGGDPAEIILWENDEPKPTKQQLQAGEPQGRYKRELAEVRNARHAAYTAADGPDAIYMQYQRGDATEAEWLAAVQAVKVAHPYPVKP